MGSKLVNSDKAAVSCVRYRLKMQGQRFQAHSGSEQCTYMAGALAFFLDMRQRGYVRVSHEAPALERAGVPIVRGPCSLQSVRFDLLFRIRKNLPSQEGRTPWAPRWALELRLALKLRRVLTKHPENANLWQTGHPLTGNRMSREEWHTYLCRLFGECLKIDALTEEAQVTLVACKLLNPIGATLMERTLAGATPDRQMYE